MTKKTETQEAQPLELRQRAMALFVPPFRHEWGYIWDANDQMVCDDRADPVPGQAGAQVARVRGWGRMSYMPDGAALQDEMGAVIAQALTEFYARSGG